MTSKEAPNKTIRGYVGSEASKDWTHRDNANELYTLYDSFRRFLFAPTDGQARLPQAVIAIDDLRVDTLAAYRLIPNAVGLPWEISINAKYLHRPMWEHAESLLHETVHLYQETGANAGSERFKGEPFKSCKGGFHSKQFVELCEEVGLHPLLGLGAHWKPGDGQFEALMTSMGYAKPEHAKGDFVKPGDTKGMGKADAWWFSPDRGKARGSSSLLKYQADPCLKAKPCVFRAGVKDLTVACLKENCSGVFRMV